jgi:hypothetical protein
MLDLYFSGVEVHVSAIELAFLLQLHKYFYEHIINRFTVQCSICFDVFRQFLLNKLNL